MKGNRKERDEEDKERKRSGVRTRGGVYMQHCGGECGKGARVKCARAKSRTKNEKREREGGGRESGIRPSIGKYP